MTDEAKSYKYDVFISYSRKDEPFARKLEQTLESYKPEKNLKVPQRHIETFRDKDDFSSGDYRKKLKSNLQDSSKLLVICSPAARQSSYVNDEIKQFINIRGTDHIIPVLFSGLPNNEAKPEQEGEKAFPDELCKNIEIPLAVNYLNFNVQKNKVNKGIFTDSWHTILADIYELSRSEIEQRERKRKVRSRRITFSLMITTIIVLSFLSAFAFVSRSQAIAALKEAETAREAEASQRKIAEEQKIEANKQRDDAIRARNETKAALDREKEAKNLAETKRQEAEQATKNEKLAKNQAEERRKEAETQTVKANDALRATYTENGRQELVNNHPFRAAVYLSEAYQIPVENKAPGKISNLLFLLKQSINAVDSLRFSLEHQSPVQSAKYSSDGKKIITVSSDGTAKIWNAETGDAWFEIPDNVESAQFSSDGEKIVTASFDNIVRVWDVESKKVIASLEHKYQIDSTKFSFDGKKIMTVSTDKTVGVWNAETGKFLASFKHQVVVQSAEFSSDGRKILTASGFDKTVKIWNISPEIRISKEIKDIVKKVGFQLKSGVLVPINDFILH